MIRASMPATGFQVSPDTQFVLFSAASFPASSVSCLFMDCLFHAVGKKKDRSIYCRRLQNMAT
jgi:hypothetical protein